MAQRTYANPDMSESPAIPFDMGSGFVNATATLYPGLIFIWILLRYYNTSLERDGDTNQIVKFGAVACITGRVTTNFSSSALKIMYYSTRGPDPENWKNFAMMSGTSMAAPHVTGLTTLIKNKYSSFSPSAIALALSTKTSLSDRNGGPIMTQRTYVNPDMSESPATPFNMGRGFVNATATLNPGLIFNLGNLSASESYNDYMSFLCGMNGSAPVVLNYTDQSCGMSMMTTMADLNLHSITIVKLNQSRMVQRMVINIAEY
ncbi:subtilisin-like protease SBT2.2 [Apium graveolens]|uniref:subtilisin-like protease SBT2.2 n=1 Tax=Apium graveolens TaxID=4045 RepID=UPI003D7A6C88